MYAREKKQTKQIERENKNFTCVVEEGGAEGEKKREKKMNTLV